MKVLVSGAREGFDQHTIEVTLGRLQKQYGDSLVIIEGCAQGVDTQAWEWAKRNRVPVLHYPAPWTHLGKPAGRWRNRAMLRVLQPDKVVAFHPDLEKSKGTRDMVEVATANKIPTHVIHTPL